jgi:RHS repeat-associated protein
MSGVRPRLTAVVLTVALVAAGVTVTPPAAVAAGSGGVRQAPRNRQPVAAVGLAAKPAPPDPATAVAAARSAAVPPPAWPAPSSVDIDVPASLHADTRQGTVPAAGTPVSIAPASPTSQPSAVPAGPSRVRVQVLDQPTARSAGVNGLLVRLARIDGASTAGTVQVGVDYSTFAGAYGADWTDRLRLVQLPLCAASTPRTPGCTQVTPLASTNDVRRHTVIATVPVAPAVAAVAGGFAGSGTGGGTMLALAAGSKSGSGNFGATSLTPSLNWSAGGNAGGFSWSYPIRVPPSLGGPSPSIGLSYSSQSVDGLMAATNNQPSWIGEGFQWSPGYIERSYKGCADDMDSTGHNNTAKTGDQCWETDNATLTMTGHSGELLKDPSDPNRWHLRNDDGTLVVHQTGAANGDNDGEWWVVTTPDGTQHWFGGTPSANSTFNSVVFGNDPGEPCHAATFAASSCVQAWRWNIDYVVDPHGNTMTYHYTKETNRYGRANSSTDLVQYDRGGYLTEIDYGTRAGDTGTAPMQVVFGTEDRCLSGCATHDKAHWPDTPWDQECTGAPCTNFGPTFWTTRRLSTITTKVAGANVEQWTFTHQFLDPADGTRAGLWLAKISHTGLANGNNTAVPDITFDGVQLANRVDTDNDHLYPMNWWRVSRIHTETGGLISVHYAAPDCVAGSHMPDPAHLESNTTRCYPVRWIPEYTPNTITDFFNKYVVDEVKQDDLTGGGPTVYTHYDYLGSPAWHYADDDGLTKTTDRTWSVWRGYATVQTRVGDPTKMTPTLTETQYFRGMNGDHLPSGSRSVTLPAVPMGGAAPVPAEADEDAYADTVRQTITYNGVGGPEISAQVDEAWESSPTATRTINGTTVYARFTNTAATHTRTALDSDGGTRTPGVRTTSKYTTFDSQGLPSTMDDRGDDAVTGDERCALTTYARNTSAWMMSFPARIRTFATDCAHVTTGGLTDDDVVGDVLTRYDGQAAGAAPTKGDVTETDELKAYNGGNPTYLTASQARYDAYGRITDSWDIDGNHSTVGYTPASGGPLTQTVATNVLGWTTTTAYDPAWGSVTSVQDPNADRTHTDTKATYDGLGRTTQVWQPGHGSAPDATYGYLVRTDGATAVTSANLLPGGGYSTSVSLLDGLLRQRETQVPDTGTSGGRIVNDTFYDSAGRAYLTADQPPLAGTPSTDFAVAKVPEAAVSQTVTTYDGSSRPVASSFYTGNTFRWVTTTSYTGDRTDVRPPTGANATSTVTDAAGHTVALRQYHAPSPTGAYDATTYTYNRKEQLVRVTDPAGTHWDYGYDLRGRQTSISDPDKGAAQSTFDDAGRLVTSTDARGETVAYTYDVLGRKTSVRDGTVTGPKRAEWVYDTVMRGQPAKSIRYDATGTYTSEVLGYDNRYQPTSTQVTIPTTLLGIFGATTFSYVDTYAVDGSPLTSRIPGAGGLPTEALRYGYNGLGLPVTLSTNLGGTLVTDTGYTDYAEPSIITLRNNGGQIAQIGAYYEDGTHRLAELKTTSAAAPTTVYADVSYGHDDAGNVTEVNDRTSGDDQCFGYDYARRLADAWTPASGGCAAVPGSTGLGGPAPYWQSWAFDASGNRKTETEHSTGGDTTHQYAYPAVTAAQPHAVTSVTSTGAVNRTDSYGYDATGNTTSRPGGRTLTWDAEGHLTSVTDPGGSTSYVYDADGNRLLRKDPGGQTLYLPGQELRAANGTVTCTRYYTWSGKTVATRTPAGLTWLSSDALGTAQIAITATTQQVALRRTTPYGDVRGATGAWPSTMDKGFVGGTADDTGLVHLGAREYDPSLGRFMSVDPVLDMTDPQQMEAYAYADSTPVTMSDPTGLKPACGLDDGKAHPCREGEEGYHAPTGGSGGGSGGGGGYVPTVINPNACGTRLCHDQQKAYLEDIARKIQEQREEAQRAAMRCATLLCHQQYQDALAGGQYDVVNENGNLVTSNGNTGVNYTPAARMKAMSEPPAPPPAPKQGCHGFWGCALHAVANVADQWTETLAHSFDSLSNFADTLNGLGSVISFVGTFIPIPAIKAIGMAMQATAAVLYLISGDTTAAAKVALSMVIGSGVGKMTTLFSGLKTGLADAGLSAATKVTGNVISRAAPLLGGTATFATNKGLCGWSPGCASSATQGG